MNRYFKCNKCGSLSKTNGGTGGMCVMPFAVRTSGICGGSFDKEISEEEYNTTIENWEKLRNDKKDNTSS